MVNALRRIVRPCLEKFANQPLHFVAHGTGDLIAINDPNDSRLPIRSLLSSYDLDAR
jgi:hypothetical protein